ncbi:uncharacterized protein CCOS01_14067 [Colletotrichum costaricense]|uniref:Uncharacterized protein n=1 Tax=Colletotrichum costaricense TaxID=1209916 RepID=A0AAI9YKE9_9PEZI|nr:uncharacterized protein CCOS01_14067 [Colletotrichum costaricense]KAK1514127.1 hypothetical protein CCOS01_14067 [Colletotrichum costaricense]
MFKIHLPKDRKKCLHKWELFLHTMPHQSITSTTPPIPGIVDIGNINLPSCRCLFHRQQAQRPRVSFALFTQYLTCDTDTSVSLSVDRLAGLGSQLQILAAIVQRIIHFVLNLYRFGSACFTTVCLQPFNSPSGPHSVTLHKFTTAKPWGLSIHSTDGKWERLTRYCHCFEFHCLRVRRGFKCSTWSEARSNCLPGLDIHSESFVRACEGTE